MIKPCPQCTQTLNIFVAECPFCGYKFSEEDDSHSDDEQMQLIQLAEYMDSYTSDKLQNIRQWQREAWKNNVSPDEPITHFIDTYGHQPPHDWMYHACLGPSYPDQKKAQFLQYLQAHCQDGKWAKQWQEYHQHLEFGEVHRNKLSLNP